MQTRCSTGPEAGRQLIISSPGGVFDALIAEVSALDTGSPTRQASQEAKESPRNTALSSWLRELGRLIFIRAAACGDQQKFACATPFPI
jgi:hypothetical protein